MMHAPASTSGHCKHPGGIRLGWRAWLDDPLARSRRLPRRSSSLQPPDQRDRDDRERALESSSGRADGCSAQGSQRGGAGSASAGSLRKRLPAHTDSVRRPYQGLSGRSDDGCQGRGNAWSAGAAGDRPALRGSPRWSGQACCSVRDLVDVLRSRRRDWWADHSRSSSGPQGARRQTPIRSFDPNEDGLAEAFHFSFAMAAAQSARSA